jgi:hypothetical protein
MGAAIDRIVVTTTPQEKRALAAKARRLGLPVSELLKRGASAYGNPSFGDDIALLADAATAAADRAAAAVEDALLFIEASERRIEAMERAAAVQRNREHC